MSNAHTNTHKKTAWSDILRAVQYYSLAGMLGWQDILQRYRRSTLGPFWITISMGTMIGVLGIVFGSIFRSPMQEFLPFLATGIILWTFISTAILDGCSGFIGAEGIIKQLSVPLFTHIMRVIWRNLLILAHNILILPIVFLVLSKSIKIIILLSIPGLLITCANLTWIALVCGILCARYRDLTQIVSNALQVFFYLTPIVWMPKLLPGRVGVYLLDFNPFYHCIEIVRAPLLGEMPSLANWVVSLSILAVGSLFTLWFFNNYKRRIAYWL